MSVAGVVSAHRLGDAEVPREIHELSYVKFALKSLRFEKPQQYKCGCGNLCYVSSQLTSEETVSRNARTMRIGRTFMI